MRAIALGLLVASLLVLFGRGASAAITVEHGNTMLADWGVTLNLAGTDAGKQNTYVFPGDTNALAKEVKHQGTYTKDGFLFDYLARGHKKCQ